MLIHHRQNHTRTVSQRLVLVPSPVWDSWPDVCFLDVYVVESIGRHPWRDGGSVLFFFFFLRRLLILLLFIFYRRLNYVSWCSGCVSLPTTSIILYTHTHSLTTMEYLSWNTLPSLCVQLVLFQTRAEFVVWRRKRERNITTYYAHWTEMAEVLLINPWLFISKASLWELNCF
jgi:hypothetical protein